MASRSRTRQHKDDTGTSKRLSIAGFWICRSPVAYPGKELVLDSIAMLFFTSVGGNNYCIFIRCPNVFSDPDDPVFITYGFSYEYWLFGSIFRRHVLGYSKRHTYDDSWRRIDGKTFEYDNGQGWERYEPTTLAELQERGFDMMMIEEFLADARRLGWRYSKAARLPSVSVARPRAKPPRRQA